MLVSSLIACGVPVVDLPRCQACGGEYVDFYFDREVEDGQARLVACACCGDAVEDVDGEFDDVCGSAPLLVDVGGSADWREAFLRCINAWSKANGGGEFYSTASLPDGLDDDVSRAEIFRGPLPDFLRLF